MFVGTENIATYMLLDEEVRVGCFDPPELWGAWWYPLGSGMDKLNLIKFYRFGVALGPLRKLTPDMPSAGISEVLSQSFSWLLDFLHEVHDVPCPKTREAGAELISEIFHLKSQLMGIEVENEKLTWQARLRSIAGTDGLLERFEREFEHDSREINIFSVPDKCVYSTTRLIDQGENVLPESVRSVVTDYDRNELHEAGRCLAFDLSTAAGFHMVRAVESVLRGYWDVVTNGEPRPKRPNGNDESMGVYVNKLEQEFSAPPKVIAVLWEVKRLYRDPVAHPEDVLDLEQAIVLLGVVTSAITAMARDINKRGTETLPFVPVKATT